MTDFSIGRRQLYILPTRMGWYFALIMVALFGIAVKFDNQAAFMMLFVLVSMGLVGMLYTHNNVIGLTLNAQAGRAVFLGEHAEFPLIINNDTNKSRHAVWITSGGFQQVLELDAHSEQLVPLKLPTIQRGYLNCDPIIVTSQFPIGVFFCWSKRYDATQRCIVYPQPLDLISMTANNQAGKQENQSAALSGNEDFKGMKQYQQGDRIRDIHWPSVAKTNKLVTIEYESLSPSSINLSWLSLPPSMSVEDKLSQLCFWVMEAEKSGYKYQLEMPNHTLSHDNGNTHYHNCLKTLALWGLGDQADKESNTTKASATSKAINKKTILVGANT